jgi:hypothetical protein
MCSKIAPCLKSYPIDLDSSVFGLSYGVATYHFLLRSDSLIGRRRTN